MTIRLTLFLFTICFTACTAPQKAITSKANETVNMDTFIQEAISEGLKGDKITTDLALEVASVNRFFINECNICKNVLKALNEHEGFSKESEMRGQVANLKLVRNEGEAGRTAFKDAIESYLDHHFENSGLTVKQKEAIQTKLKEEAKKGKMLITGYSFCPSCTGAEGACKVK
jgi:hypothetical protein